MQLSPYRTLRISGQRWYQLIRSSPPEQIAFARFTACGRRFGRLMPPSTPFRADVHAPVLHRTEGYRTGQGRAVSPDLRARTRSQQNLNRISTESQQAYSGPFGLFTGALEWVSDQRPCGGTHGGCGPTRQAQLGVIASRSPVASARSSTGLNGVQLFRRIMVLWIQNFFHPSRTYASWN